MTDDPEKRALAVKPYASLCFDWVPLQKQVRVEGTGAWRMTYDGRHKIVAADLIPCSLCEALSRGHSTMPARWSAYP